jgi:16S rRNA (uracil1498-N3)-methyltransferase
MPWADKTHYGLFVECHNIRDDVVLIDDLKTIHHALDVLRVRKGSLIKGYDGKGTIFTLKVEGARRDLLTCGILKRDVFPRETLDWTLAQAIVKVHTFENIVRALTEMGISNIIPLRTHRSRPTRPNPDRLNRILRGASIQSRRPYFPVISPVKSLDEVIHESKAYDLSLIFDIEGRFRLRDVLKDETPNTVLFVVGPEGGFERSEVSLAEGEGGMVSVRLPFSHILTSETAALVAFSVLRYELSRD